MSDRELKAIISATDKASPVFKQVATGADKMGTSVESAGKKGAKGLADQGKSATDVSAKMAALGAVTATAAGVLAGWARSSEDAAAIQRQLEASIAATGEEYSTYADRIQAAGERAVQLGQDDEAASQAISALTQTTGSANVALDQMGLVMDLAAAKHMSLESAAELVGKVIEGNTGILNRAGFAIDANATATEALAQVQTAVAGQAEASATTYARMREEISNVTDAIGGAVGGFAPLLAMLPGVSVGFSAVGSAVGALAPNLTKAGAASAALDLALGPVGIVAAAALAGVAIFEFAKKADAAHLSVKEAAKEVKDFDETLASLGKGGTDSDALEGLAGMRDIIVQLALDSEHASQARQSAQQKENDAWDAAATAAQGGSQAQIDATRAALDAAKEYSDQLDGTILTQDQLTQVAKDFKHIWTDQNPLNFDLVLAQLDHLRFQLDNGVISADEYIKAVDDLNEHSDSYGLTIEEIVKGQRNQAGSTRDLTATINELTEAQDRQASAQSRQSGNILEGPARATSRMKQLEAAAYSMAEATQAAGGAVKQQTAEQAAAESQMNGLEDAAYSMAGAQQNVAAQTNEARAQMQAAADAAKGYADALVGTASFASKIRPVDIDVRGGDKVTGTAADLQKTQSILGSVLGTFKTLDSLGQASEQADSIAQNLIGEPGELATIDRLLKQGRISQDEYTAAIQAGNRISKESGAIENDLNTIRAKQLPLLADADRQYGNLIDRISHMSAEQATATLGFMDSAESMKAQNAVALAASAAMGELGDAGEATATKIIAGAAEADPVLKEMLKNIGLVTEDKEGNIKVNFPNAESLNDSVDTLTGSINDLAIAIDLLDGKPDLDITVKFLADQAKKDAADTKKAINDIPEEHNTTVTETGSDSTRTAARGTKKDVEDIPDSSNTTITVDDQASGPIGNVIGLLNSLEGRSVSTTITNTVNNVTNNTTNNATNGAPSSPFDATGGMVNFASGGLVTLAEAGPELLRFANGGMGMAMSRGMYAVPDSTLVYNAPATKAKMGGGGGQTFNITVQGDINGMSGVNEVMAAFKIAAREHFAGYRS